MNFEKIGKKIISYIDYLGGISALFVFSFVEIISARMKGDKAGRKLIKDIIKKQILFTGYDALTIISIIALSLGVVIIIQSVTQLMAFGVETMIGKILNTVILRELGPILTAIIIIGRSGTAIATEIGNMKVNHEIEALEAMGIDTLRFVVFPRIVGGMVSVTALTIYFSFVGILGGFIVASFYLTIPFSKFFDIIFTTMELNDLMILFIKSIVFGAIITTLSVYYGFKVKMSSTEVPQAVTKAVVSSLIFTFVFNGIVTVMFYV